MKLIQCLESGETLDSIVSRLNLIRVDHEDGRTILNYDQILSPRKDPIVMECRGIVVDRNENKVVARTFPRFFNWGEFPEQHAKFDWTSALVQEKLDGSLIVAYWWKGEWRFNTRGSFADGLCGESGQSWSNIVKNILSGAAPRNDATWVFELCSPWNQVVAYHDKPKLVLLSGFDPALEDGELAPHALDAEAKYLGVERPKLYSLSSAQDCIDFLFSPDVHATFEGFVARDKNGMRIKIKNARYVALHHLSANKNIYLTKNLVPLILSGETEEVLAYFPDAKKRILEIESKITQEKSHMLSTWESAKNIEDQKEFAIAIKDSKLKGVLFTARKTKTQPAEILNKMPEYVLKVLFPKEE